MMRNWTTGGGSPALQMSSLSVAIHLMNAHLAAASHKMRPPSAACWLRFSLSSVTEFILHRASARWAFAPVAETRWV